MARERGFAMIWALLLLIVVGALGASILERDATMQRDGQTERVALEAFHAAEGGLARARAALAHDPAWRGEHLQVGASDVVVRVTPNATGEWQVATEARPGNVRLEATLRPQAGLPSVHEWRRVR